MAHPLTPLCCCSAHFESHAYFGLCSAQVTFFQQGWLPCMTEEGSILMESSSQVCVCVQGRVCHGTAAARLGGRRGNGLTALAQRSLASHSSPSTVLHKHTRTHTLAATPLPAHA